MVTCRQFVEFLLEYITGGLAQAQREEFESHLAACTACVTYMNTYLETIKLGRAAFEDLEGSVPEEVPEELVQAVLLTRTRGE